MRELSSSDLVDLNLEEPRGLDCSSYYHVLTLTGQILDIEKTKNSNIIEMMRPNSNKYSQIY